MSSGAVYTQPSVVYEGGNKQRVKLFLDKRLKRAKPTSKQVYRSSEFDAPSLPEDLRLAAQEIVTINGVDAATIHWSTGGQPHLRLVISSPAAIPTAQEVLWQNSLLEYESIVSDF